MLNLNEILPFILSMFSGIYKTRVEIELREEGTGKIKSKMRDIDLTEKAVFTGRLFQREMPYS